MNEAETKNDNFTQYEEDSEQKRCILERNAYGKI